MKARRTGATGWTERYDALRTAEAGADVHRRKTQALAEAEARNTLRVQKADAAIQNHKAEIASVSKHTQIYKVDTEVDQILLAFKLIFLNLCHLSLARYCDGKSLEMDTLINATFTPPGARALTRANETIRIYRQTRDPETMAIVAAACERLTEKRLQRDKRRLIFELVERTAA